MYIKNHEALQHRSSQPTFVILYSKFDLFQSLCLLQPNRVQTFGKDKNRIIHLENSCGNKKFVLKKLKMHEKMVLLIASESYHLRDSC